VVVLGSGKHAVLNPISFLSLPNSRRPHSQVIKLVWNGQLESRSRSLVSVVHSDEALVLAFTLQGTLGTFELV